MSDQAVSPLAQAPLPSLQQQRSSRVANDEYDLNRVISRASGQRLYIPAEGQQHAASSSVPFTHGAHDPSGATSYTESPFDTVGSSSSLAALDPCTFDRDREFDHQQRSPSAPGDPNDDRLRREGSLQELTRRASKEDELIKSKSQTPAGLAAARDRTSSLNQGKAAGLASPYVSPAPSAQANSSPAGVVVSSPGSGQANVKYSYDGRASTTRECKGAPPIAGVTQGAARQYRARSSSVSSAGSVNGSVNKDRLLEELSSALRLEKRRVQHYEEEILKCEEEIDTLNRALDAQQEQHDEEARKQDLTIQSLRMQLDELKDDLDAANDLEPEEAHEYLALLGKADATVAERPLPPSPETKKAADRAERRHSMQAVMSELPPKASARTAGASQGRKLGRRLSKPPSSPFGPLEKQLASRMEHIDIGRSDHKRSSNAPPPVAGMTRPVSTHKRSNSWKKLQSTLRVVFPSSTDRREPLEPPESHVTPFEIPADQPSNAVLERALRNKQGANYGNVFA